MLNEQVLSNNTQVLSEGISLFFLVLQLYLFRSNNPRNWILGGLALGLTFASRYPIGVQSLAILLAEIIFNNNVKLFRNALVGAAPVVLLVVGLVFLKTGAFQMAIEQDSHLALIPSSFYFINSIQIWGLAFIFVPVALIFRRTYHDRKNYVFIVWFVIGMLFWSMSASNFNYRFATQFTPAVYYLAILGIWNLMWHFKNGFTKFDLVFFRQQKSGVSVSNDLFLAQGQKFTKDGKLYVNSAGWIIRSIGIITLASVIAYNFILSMRTMDPFIAYTTLIPVYVLTITLVGWFFYRNPAIKAITYKNPLRSGKLDPEKTVSIVMPLYNQKSIIKKVIESIFNSNLKNPEVIIVDDGSTDGSGEVVDRMAKRYPNMKVIHKENDGKRRAILKGVLESKGDYLIFIDSDSLIHPNAFTELVHVLNSDKKIGAAVGCIKVWNSDKNIVTKCQDSWYDYAFNVAKSAESFFNNVLCCTGCLAAYRRDSIFEFIHQYWSPSSNSQKVKSKVNYNLSHKLKTVMASYDDSEDRALTSGILSKENAVYVASALAYTFVPSNFRQWVKQQLRWQKGYLRAALYLSTIFWKKHPVMSFMFYTELVSAFSMPVILVLVLFYFPIVVHNLAITLSFFMGMIVTGFLSGIDYKLRDTATQNWPYKILMHFLLAFVFSWLIIAAVFTYRKDNWLTR